MATATATKRRKISTRKCGFCATGDHDICARTHRNGKVPNTKIDRLITCGCVAPGCPARKLRCMDCKNVREDEIDPESMLCSDREACVTVQEQRRADSPFYQQIKQIKEKVMADQKVEKAEKAAKAPKVGTCLVTGKPTKGGKFLPGMDAKYVSLRVEDVLEKRATEAQARKRILDETGSEALVGKFDKSIANRKAKAEKAAEAAKAKAEAKKVKDAEAKAAKEKAAAEKKAAEAKKAS